jgi:hypothetical protein
MSLIVIAKRESYSDIFQLFEKLFLTFPKDYQEKTEHSKESCE